MSRSPRSSRPPVPGPLTFPCPICPPSPSEAFSSISPSPQFFPFRFGHHVDGDQDSSSSSLPDLLHAVCVVLISDDTTTTPKPKPSSSSPISPLLSPRPTSGSTSSSSSSSSGSASESESESEVVSPHTPPRRITSSRLRLRCVIGTKSLGSYENANATRSLSEITTGTLLVESEFGDRSSAIRLGKMCAVFRVSPRRGGGGGGGRAGIDPRHCVVFVVPLLVKEKNLFRLRLAWFEMVVCVPPKEEPAPRVEVEVETASERDRERVLLTGRKRGRRRRDDTRQPSSSSSSLSFAVAVGPSKKRQKLLIDEDEPGDDELDVFYRDSTIVPPTSENPLWLNDPDLVNSGFGFTGDRGKTFMSVRFENRGFVICEVETEMSESVSEDVFACVLSDDDLSRPVVVIDEDSIVVGFGKRIIRGRLLRDQSGVRFVDVVVWKELPCPVSCVAIPPNVPSLPQVTWGVTPEWVVFSGLRGGEIILHYLVDGRVSWSMVAQLWQDSIQAIVFPSCPEEGSDGRNEVPVVVGELGRFVVLTGSGEIETCDLGLRSKVDSVVVQEDVVVVASVAGELMAMHPRSKSRHCLDVGGLCHLSSRRGCSEIFGFVPSTNRVAVISGSLSPQALDKLAFSSLERSKRVIPSLLNDLAENSVAKLESERDLLTSRLRSGNIAFRVFRDCPLRWKMFPRLAGGLYPEVDLVVKNEGSCVLPSECWSLSFLLRPDFALVKQHDLVLSFPLPFPMQPGATIRKSVNLRELLVGTYSPIEVRAVLSFRWTDEPGSVIARDIGEKARLIPMIDFVRRLEPGESRPKAGVPLGLPIRLRFIVPSMMSASSQVHSFKMRCSEREGQFLPPEGEVRIVTHLGDILTIVRSRSFIRVQGTSYMAVAAMRHALVVPRLVGDKEGFDADILAHPPSTSRQDLADLRSSIDSRRDVLIELLHRLQTVVSEEGGGGGGGVIDCPAEVLVSEASAEWENLKRIYDEQRKILNELAPESPQ